MFARRATTSELLLGTEPERGFLRTTQERTAVPAIPPPRHPATPPLIPPGEAAEPTIQGNAAEREAARLSLARSLLPMRGRCSLLVLAAAASLSRAAPAELLNGQSHTLGLTAHFADGREPGRTVKRLHASGDVTIISLADTGSESAPLGSSANAANPAGASAPVAQQASDASGGGGGGGGPGEPPEIMFAVLTGKEHHQDRAEASKQTWCTDINACIFFSDKPSESLPTVSISFEGLPQSLSKYSKAQLRYVPVLNYMRELIMSGQDEMFAKAKWLVIVDDDTFVFHHNLASYLRTLDDTTPIYTGDVVPDEWLPVSRDGMGNELGVSSPTVFVNGGGGSVFSRAALQKMDTERCVNNTMPGQPWWRWQSDWMIGACAADAGITPLRQPQVKG
jgi:hypothetical protein